MIENLIAINLLISLSTFGLLYAAKYTLCENQRIAEKTNYLRGDFPI
jgi:hypothetical protein